MKCPYTLTITRKIPQIEKFFLLNFEFVQKLKAVTLFRSAEPVEAPANPSHVAEAPANPSHVAEALASPSHVAEALATPSHMWLWCSPA